MPFSVSKLIKLLFIYIIFVSISSKAEPWIDTSDIYLKAHIQLLADAGHIATPVTTYPLMWQDIIQDLKQVNRSYLSENQKNAYYYIQHQFRLANKNQNRVKAQLSANNNQWTSFGDSFREKNSIQIQSSMMTDNFAMKISPSYFPSTDGNDEMRFDDSYIAAFWGNWIVSIGQQDKWFGPTWDTSFSLTNNARPIPAISLSRKSATPFTLPFTELDIPWTVTTFMEKMNDKRTVKNALLWGFRLNFKPLKNLEVGLSRLAQWGGDGRSKSLSTFWDVLIGRTNCGIDDLVCDDNTLNPANQQAGYDFRYSNTLFNVPVAIYAQKFAEDGSADPLKFLTKAELQVGIDANFNLFNIPTTAFIEYSDSLADCGTRDNIGDCYYEHSSYSTGMRFNGRTISNLYDNDAKTYVFGAYSQLSINTHLTNKLRYLQLNYDNSDKAPNNPLIGNPITSIAKDMVMFSSSVQHSYRNWRFTVSGNVSYSSFKNNLDNETDYNASLTVEYNL